MGKNDLGEGHSLYPCFSGPVSKLEDLTQKKRNTKRTPSKISGWNLKIYPIEQENCLPNLHEFGFHVKFPGCCWICLKTPRKFQDMLELISRQWLGLHGYILHPFLKILCCATRFLRCVPYHLWTGSFLFTNPGCIFCF